MSAQIKDGGPVDVLAEMQADIDALEQRVLAGEFTLSRGYNKVNRLRSIHAAVAELIEAAKMANGDHSAPHDCYATGPLTGDPVMDLVVCPGCRLAAALARVGSTK